MNCSMLNRYFALLIALLTLLACSSCVPESGGAGAVPTQAADRPLSYAEVFDPSTDFDDRFGRGFANIAETEDAYYFALSGRLYIYFYDKHTGEYGVLCGRPDCTHDADPGKANTECGGYKGCWGGTTMNKKGDRLYYLGETDRTSSNIGCALYSMALDGSDHRKHFPLNCDDRFAPQRFEIHRGKAYGTNYYCSIEQAEPKSFYNVVCWDLGSGDLRVIYDRVMGGENIVSPWPCVSYFGKHVYILDSYPTSGAEAGSNSIVEIFRWDTEAETLEQVFSSGDNGLPGVDYTMWVEAENRLILAPMSRGGSDEHPIYALENGGLKKILSLTEKMSVRLVGGLCVGFDFRKDHEKQVSIWDLDGRSVWSGTWDLDIIAGADPDCYSISAIFGDRNDLYFVYEVRGNETVSAKTCVVKYDLRNAGPTAKVLCIVEDPSAQG